MKHTQRKDALRNIWKQRVSYLSVVIIAMLAVMAYLGINFAAQAMWNNSNDFYDETRFRDVEIISTLLVSESDLEVLRAVEGVAEAEGVFQTEADALFGGERASVGVASLTQKVNVPQVLEGRLPQTAGECALEQPVAEALGLTVGDAIRLQGPGGGNAAYLTADGFTVTGIVFSPEHACWPDSIPGNRDVIVPGDAFDLEALDGCYMKAELLIEKDGTPDRFSEEYMAALDEVMGRLEELSAVRTAARERDVREQAQTKIDEGQTELDSGAAELSDARAELDDGWARLADGEQELADGEVRLEEAKAELEEAWQKLQDAQAELDAAQEQLDAAKAELDSGAAELRAAENRLASARSQLVSGWEELEDAKESIRNVIRTGLAAVIGEQWADAIPWAARQSVDLSGSVSATDFWITDSVRFDLSMSSQEYFERLLSSSRIPDEVLIAAYEELTGGGEE